jgi:ribosomal protein L11 methyltransferase
VKPPAPEALDPRLVRVGIRVRAEQADDALARLLPVLAAGAEERSLGNVVEYSLYGVAAEVPSDERVQELAGDALVEVVHEPVATGWERRWHEFLEPVRVGELVIRPPWIAGDASDVVIDPGLSFGAGGHPTTRLCLRLLLDAEPGGALCDWGAGTGILGIVAARLGWSPVTAVEPDREALATIASNAAANGVNVRFARGDVTDAPPWAPTVAANLSRPLLVAAAERVERPPDRLLASGFLAREADEVVAAWGMREDGRLVEDEWAAVELVAP